MSKFKIGDRVKRNNSDSPSWKYNCNKAGVDEFDVAVVINVDLCGDLKLEINGKSIDNNYHWININFDLIQTTNLKTLTANELYEHIKLHDITKCKISKSLEDIPSGTILYFGKYSNEISTYHEDTNDLNKKFGYDFDYRWSNTWHNNDDMRFELVDYTDSPGQTLIDEKMEIDEIKKFDKTILKNAEKEAIEEIAKEQTDRAKQKFKELMNQVSAAKETSDIADANLADLKKSLNGLSPKGEPKAK